MYGNCLFLFNKPKTVALVIKVFGINPSLLSCLDFAHSLIN